MPAVLERPARKVQTRLEFLAKLRHGGLDEAAPCVGISRATLYRARNGYSVNDETIKKIETYFGFPMEVLLKPWL
jgi:hypothetical protein